ncbi:glycosyltransferase [Reichenbachiella carrageenanivorans]|uniref:Glycosyltransferase n=1 Tax=Reichenbachiella carrageenanivorans TaxID=2979869 RepID=A0ABY6D4J6_9BACT|nr:glycosyltransferase [Reichenbachiella carrageenanivorans]UXX80043.1 glycosyltransferase [Reichenbachiella carrageenanivorans]
MENPLVSVICLCYNQARFVKEALDAVANQTYAQVQLIVVDDASTDHSREVIAEWLTNRPEIVFIDLRQNLGNTQAFNQGLALAKGKYVIDLAGDDVLTLDRIEKQVAFFEQQEERVGVIYSDALYIDESGKELYRHFYNTGMIAYEGNVYEKLIDTYFVPTPTMMIRKRVLDELGGYDENLAYEDFDFWVRSSRNWLYAYQAEMLTYVRLLRYSQSTSFYQKGDSKVGSTLIVCQKAQRLNQSESENAALINRLRYEIRHAFLAGKNIELQGFFQLWAELAKIPMTYMILKRVGVFGLNFNWLKKPIQRLMN